MAIRAPDGANKTYIKPDKETIFKLEVGSLFHKIVQTWNVCNAHKLFSLLCMHSRVCCKITPDLVLISSSAFAALVVSIANFTKANL